MRAAVVDLGTNTFNLLIADCINKQMVEVTREKRSVKLGKGGLAQKIIVEDAYKRAINVIEEYKNILNKYNVKNVKVVATSAFRSTENGKSLAKEIESILQSPVDIIDGNKEAYYIYKGIINAIPIKTQPVLMIDIGGGSNELIIGTSKEILWSKSYNLGISRLIELFKPSDPLLPEQIKKIYDYIQTETNDLKQALKQYPVSTLVGSSGSFDTLANILSWRIFNRDLDFSKSFNVLNVFQLIRVLDLLIVSTYDQRKDILGMDLTRIEMMPIAALFIRTIFEYFSCTKVIHSAYAIKEGVWFSTFNCK